MKRLNKEFFSNFINNQKDILIIVFLVIISSFIMFHNLGSFPIQDWDEARHAENALEILKTNDWVVINYGGQPELWNLKPPLGAWLIALSFKMFGLTAFALRFWSVLAGIGIIILVYLFGKSASNRLTGFISAVLMLTMPMFLMEHAVRTGNYDALLTFFITLSFYLFYLYIKTEKPKLLIFTAVSLSLAFMIKGLVGILPILIILIYSLSTKSFTKIIRRKEFGYSILTYLLIISPWIILRCIRGKEFFIKMIHDDVIQRSSVAIEGHYSNWYSYFETLKYNLGLTLSILAVAGFIYLVYLTFKKDKFALLIVLWISSFLLIFTLAKTRIFWYIIPIYPAIGLVMGYSLGSIQKKFKINQIVFLIIFCILVTAPCIKMFKMTNDARVNYNYQLASSFKDDLSTVNNLYISKEYQRQQGLSFMLSSYIKGNVILYEEIDEISLGSNDLILMFSKVRFDRINIDDKYQLVKEIDGWVIFRKK